MTPQDEPSRLQGAQYAPAEEQRTVTNSFRKNEVVRPKQKQSLAMDVSGGENQVQCCKEQYCIGT